MVGVFEDNRADGMRQDNSGTIEREEFLSLPQISSNPLATRSVAPPFTGTIPAPLDKPDANPLYPFCAG